MRDTDWPSAGSLSAARPAGPGDRALLEAALAEAAAWREGVTRPVADVIEPPAIRRYLAGWPAEGDHGVVVEGAGACWWRGFTTAAPGWGFVRADVPELTVGVLPAWRGQGVGTRLLSALVADATAAGLPGLSLSVEDGNPARRLYDRLGFAPVDRSGAAMTMVRWLDARG